MPAIPVLVAEIIILNYGKPNHKNAVIFWISSPSHTGVTCDCGWFYGVLLTHPPCIYVLQRTTEIPRPASTNLTEEVQRLQEPMQLQALDLLQSLSFNLPNKTIPQETANNLTQVKMFLKTKKHWGKINKKFTDLLKSSYCFNSHFTQIIILILWFVMKILY